MHVFVVAILLCQEPAAEGETAAIASPLKPQDAAEVPFSFDVIERADIERRLARTTPEFFGEARGIAVQKDSFGLEVPAFRGMSGSRVIFLIDGVRLNTGVFRDIADPHWNTVDPFLFDRVEAARGAVVLPYGGDALGGAVAGQTREPERFPESFELRARSFYRYASAENSHVAREEISALSSSSAILAGVGIRSFDKLVGGREVGEMPATAYDGFGGDVKVVLNLAGGGRVTFAVQADRQFDVPITHRTIDSVPWHGTLAGTDLKNRLQQERDLVYVQLRFGKMGSWVDELETGVSYHRQQEDLERIDAAANEVFRTAEVRTGGCFARVGKRTPLGFLTAGGEFYADIVNSTGLDRTSGGLETRYDRGEVADGAVYDLAGLYVQDEVDVSDRVAFTVGARFAWTRLNAGEADASAFGGPAIDSFKETRGSVIGAASLLYRATDHVNLILQASQGFRPPNVDDATAVRTFLSGQTLFPNPGLTSERSLALEMGMRAHYESLRAEAFGFVEELDDFIAPREEPSLGPGAFVKDNSRRARIYGVELYVEYRLATTWVFWADLSSSVGEADVIVAGEWERHPIGRMNPVTAHAGVRYAPKGAGHFLEGVLTTAHTQRRRSPADLADVQEIPPEGTPGWSAVTLRGGLELLTNVRGTVAIENVFDRDFRIHGSGINETGTNVVFGLEVKM